LWHWRAFKFFLLGWSRLGFAERHDPGQVLSERKERAGNGPSRGLGAAIAIALAQAGANVACHGRSEEGKKTSERIRQLGRNSVDLAGDFAKREVQTELIKKARGTWINRHSCE
jgi:short subunit dehydrogenase